MRWQTKAAIARWCAQVPLGESLYRFGQRRFGELRVQPLPRLHAQLEMTRWLRAQGLSVRGADLLEVGTGHIPVVPIGFYLSGARRSLTLDLNRRIDWALTGQTLEWMASRPREMAALYGAEIVDPPVFEERFARLVEGRGRARQFLESAGIEYLAPRDAARTGMPAHSIDCHYSMTVLEHIPPPALQAILKEARRILKPGAVALHFIDPSDHFEQQDRSITPINFLQFSEREWLRLAGNRFAYCNRLRASDLLRLGAAAGFTLARSEATVDERSKRALREGFALDPQFAGYEVDDACTTALRVMWQ